MTRRGRAGLLAFIVAGCGGGGPPCDRCGLDGAPDSSSPGTAAVLAVGPTGQLALLGLEAPWTPGPTADLATPVASVRYHAGRFYIVHPTPADRVSVVAAADLAPLPALELPAGADPRDIAFVDAHTAVISQRGADALARVDLDTGAIDPTAIDLAPLADPGEGVRAGMMATCGGRVFLQLQRDASPGLGVVDVTPTSASVIRTVATTAPPAFVMPVDCASTLYVAEPIPLMLGGGTYEQIDLATLAPSALAIWNHTGEVGGFVMTGAQTGWIIFHTEFGPSPSSHLSDLPDHEGVWNTFADAHVDHLAYDAATAQVFYPDACTVNCAPGAATGIQVFDAVTAAQRSPAAGISVGFPPIDVVIAR